MKTILLSILTLVFVTKLSLAQTDIEIAHALYKYGYYCEGVAKCKEAFQKVNPKSKTAKKQKGELAFMTAECLRNTDRFAEALDWYERAVKLQYDKINPNVLLRIGDMNLALCDIEAAEKAFKKYKDSKHNDKIASARLQNIDYNKSAIANRTKHNVKPIAKINSANSDMAPTVGDKKSATVVFSTSRPGTMGGKTSEITCEPFMDIYVAEVDKKGNFDAPAKLQGSNINTQDNEGSVCFDSKFKQMFFTRCPSVSRQNMGCEIWVSEGGNGNWGDPVKIDLKGGNDTITVGHPCLTPEDDVLIFASNLPGGYGGLDLWYSVYNKRSKSWSSPKNMGSEINTPGNEMFPTMDDSGTLFFSSDGHVGMGGLDIFMATRVGDEIKWVKPANMGYPVNSCANDFHFVKRDERYGYFTSNRPHTDAKGAYRDNIWQWELPPNLFTLDVRVHEVSWTGVKGAAVADAKVKIVGSDGSTWEGLTDDEGKVYYEIKPDGSRYIKEETSYKIYVTKDGIGDQGFFPNDGEISTINMDRSFNFVKEIPILGKKPIELPEVRYLLGKHELLVNSEINSKDSLNYVMEVLQMYPTLIIQLTSHTDWRGNAADNKSLSQRRAQACVDYLVKEKGVDPRRLRARGAGREQPRTVYFYKGGYHVEKPEDKSVQYETIILTNDYIKQFEKTNKALFEKLHQFNRRTQGEVVSFDFDPATAGEKEIKIEDITTGEGEEKKPEPPKEGN